MRKKIDTELIQKSLINLSVALVGMFLLAIGFYIIIFAAAALMIFRLLY